MTKGSRAGEVVGAGLLAQLPQAGDEGDLLALVELQPDLLGQHDGGDVGEQARPDDLTHGSSIPSAR